MSEQTEAQRLADELVALHGYPLSIEAAAELRRLHKVNADLLEALQSVVGWMDAPDESAFSDTQLAFARAAIAKATKE